MIVKVNLAWVMVVLWVGIALLEGVDIRDDASS